MSVAAPLALEGFLPAWDVERRRVRLEPVVAWALAQLRAQGIAADALSQLHRQLDARGALRASQGLTAASLAPAFRQLLHGALREALPELPWGRLWVQTYAHFRILLPGAGLGPVPAHTDYGFGHALCERNLWLALTDAAGPGALQLASLSASLAWVARAGRQRQVPPEGPALAPADVRQGELLLFTPLHVHGSSPPVAATRVSIDLRLRPARAEPVDFTFSPPLSPS